MAHENVEKDLLVACFAWLPGRPLVQEEASGHAAHRVPAERAASTCLALVTASFFGGRFLTYPMGPTTSTFQVYLNSPSIEPQTDNERTALVSPWCRRDASWLVRE